MHYERPWPKKLDTYSALIGKNRALTQGPGGNTSVKLGELIWVKASGLNLADAGVRSIFCAVDRDAPTTSLFDTDLRPSIESFLHVYIPYPSVVHVHSVGSIALAIRKNLKSEHFELLDKCKLGYIEYVKPGKELGIKILKLIEREPQIQGAILQNHGIVLWGREIKHVYKSLIKIEDRICRSLGINTNTIFSKEMRDLLKETGLLTPDHAVFSHLIYSTSSSQENQWIEDLIWCLALAVKSIKKNEEIQILNQREVDELLNWDLEKKRQEIQK